MNPWPLVVADYRSNRLGVVAIILLVALATALGVAVSAQDRALRQGSARAADPFDLLIGAPGSETQLVLSTVYLQPGAVDLVPGSILQTLGSDPSVAWASPLGFGDNYAGHPVIGVAPAFVSHLAGGGRLEGEAFTRLDQAVVGVAVPLRTGDRFLPTHGQIQTDEEDEHDALTYQVSGRLPRLGSPWDRAILVPIEAVWWLHSLPVGHEIADEDDAQGDAHHQEAEDLAKIPIGPPWDAQELPGVPAIVVKPVSFAAAYQLRSTYRQRDDTMAVFPAEVLVKLYGLLGDVRDVVAALSVMTELLVVGAILLAVVASLAQRRRVVAVLRAVGASRRFVFATVWLGVAAMLAVAGLLGLGLGYLGAFALSHMLAADTGVDLPVRLSWQEARLVIAMVVLGVLIALIPAALAYRGSVAAALRS